MSVCKYKFLIILIIVFLYLLYLYKNTEGFNDDFTNYSKTLPNSFIYNSARTKYNDIFSFYKGKGTYKREEIKDTVSDEKISILNKLLDKLLNRISSDSQDCVGDFDKYSECDKLCGSGGFQTRKYVITQEKGINGKECPYEDGHEEKIDCFLKDCGEGGECERNRDCSSRNCDPKDKKCGIKVECTKETTHVCDEDECRRLNEEYSNASHVLEGKYLYNKRNKKCFFKTPAEMEKLNVNLYTYNYENPGDYTWKDDTCAYYQDFQDGVCVNRDKVILVADDTGSKPKCELGWKPEPTLLNKGHACQKCSLGAEQEEGKCVCPYGYVFKDDGSGCKKDAENTTGLCNPDITKADGSGIKINPRNADGTVDELDETYGNCTFCEYNEYFYRKDNVAACYPCKKGMVTERALSWAKWGIGNDEGNVSKTSYLDLVNIRQQETCSEILCDNRPDPDPDPDPGSDAQQTDPGSDAQQTDPGSVPDPDPESVLDYHTNLDENWPTLDLLKNVDRRTNAALNLTESDWENLCQLYDDPPHPCTSGGKGPDCACDVANGFTTSGDTCVRQCYAGSEIDGWDRDVTSTDLISEWISSDHAVSPRADYCDPGTVAPYVELSCTDGGILKGKQADDQSLVTLRGKDVHDNFSKDELCTACPVNTSRASGESICSPCPEDTWAKERSTECSDCPVGYPGCQAAVGDGCTDGWQQVPSSQFPDEPVTVCVSSLRPSCEDGLYDPSPSAGGDGTIDHRDACYDYEKYAAKLGDLPNFCPPGMDNCHVEHSNDVDAECDRGHRVKWSNALYLNNPHHISNMATEQVGNPYKDDPGEVVPGPHVLPGGIKSIDTTMVYPGTGPNEEHYFYPCATVAACNEAAGVDPGTGNMGLLHVASEADTSGRCFNVGFTMRSSSDVCNSKYMPVDYGTARVYNGDKTNGLYYQCQLSGNFICMPNIESGLCGHPDHYIT